MEEVRFEELNLYPEIMRAIEDMGFEEASPIQAKAIPAMCSGRDIIGQAQTGTGKTAAFGIPLLQKIDPKSKKLQAVVLCPTRELAIQVAQDKIHAWYQSTAGLWWTRDCKTNSSVEERYTDYYRYSRTSYGSYA